MTFDPHHRARFLVDETRVAGVSPQEAVWLGSHVADCEECARYDETIDGIVRGLRSLTFECDSVVSARVESALVAHVRKPSRRPSRWALAAAAALMAALVPLYRSVRDERREKADALLMERVESRVRRPVPLAMEPLMQSQPEAFQ